MLIFFYFIRGMLPQHGTMNSLYVGAGIRISKPRDAEAERTNLTTKSRGWGGGRRRGLNTSSLKSSDSTGQNSKTTSGLEGVGGERDDTQDHTSTAERANADACET